MTICVRATWYGLRWATRINDNAECTIPGITASESPPARLTGDLARVHCLSCEHYAVCHEDALPLPTCRSCAHVTPMTDKQGGWHCSAWGDRIPLDTQRTGCTHHLYHPEIVSFLRPIAGDMKANWIQFQGADGATWINGLPLKEGDPWKQGRAGAITSAAAYAAQQESSVLSEIVMDSGIPAATLMDRPDQVQDADWEKLTDAIVLFYNRWKEQPEKLERMRKLIERIDIRYQVLEKARAAQ